MLHEWQSLDLDDDDDDDDDYDDDDDDDYADDWWSMMTIHLINESYASHAGGRRERRRAEATA